MAELSSEEIVRQLRDEWPDRQAATTPMAEAEQAIPEEAMREAGNVYAAWRAGSSETSRLVRLIARALTAERLSAVEQ